MIAPDDATKSAVMDAEATATKSTITLGVGSNDTGVMEQGKRIKGRIQGLSICTINSLSYLLPELILFYLYCQPQQGRERNQR